jgi:cytoplasmic iron level regulating protein YaaA (DUF328/UPF0246 family)
MKILFAPSQSKNSTDFDSSTFDINKLVFNDLSKYREEVLIKYKKYVKNLSTKELSLWFGLKNIEHTKKYIEDIESKSSQKAVLRYSGVAYEALDYKNLDDKSQKYIDNNLIIFSDLFGAVMARDNIPNYRLKQGAKIDGFAIDKFYKKYFSSALDDLCGDFIVDLRASHYDGFYKINGNYVTFKFLKNGKTVSHYAKKYRGIVLKEMAIQNISTKDELLAHNFSSLTIIDKKNIKNMTQIICKVE